jgi:hypothetical protein
MTVNDSINALAHSDSIMYDVHTKYAYKKYVSL